jgi:hypothetical protein
MNPAPKIRIEKCEAAGRFEDEIGTGKGWKMNRTVPSSRWYDFRVFARVMPPQRHLSHGYNK